MLKTKLRALKDDGGYVYLKNLIYNKDIRISHFSLGSYLVEYLDKTKGEWCHDITFKPFLNIKEIITYYSGYFIVG
jgi:hypothetical protein